MSILALLACEHQYLAIPDAEVISGTPQYYYTNQWVGQTPPTYTLDAGSMTLAPGESFTMTVDFSAEVEFEVTELVFLGLEDGASEFMDHWVYELDEEERACRCAEVTVHALAEKPTQEWCTPKRLGTWTCYELADEGVSAVGMSTAGEDSISEYTQLPITLEPLREPAEGGASDDCDIDYRDHCPWAGSNFSIEPPCGCPDETPQIGTSPEGWATCQCPG